MDAIKTAKVWIGERKGITSPIHVSQYDTGWTFVLAVYKDDVIYTSDAAVSVVMEGLKADGTTFAVPGTFADGVATIVSTVAMTAAAGVVECELRLSEGGETVGTGNFDLIVEASPIEGGTPSEDDYTAMQTLIDNVSEAYADTIGNVQAAQAAQEGAEAAQAAAEEAQEAAEDAQAAAEAAAGTAAAEAVTEAMQDLLVADVPERVADWLETNITQETGYVVDKSLSVEGAAADAKYIGDIIKEFAHTEALTFTWETGDISSTTGEPISSASTNYIRTDYIDYGAADGIWVLIPSNYRLSIYEYSASNVFIQQYLDWTTGADLINVRVEKGHHLRFVGARAADDPVPYIAPAVGVVFISTKYIITDSSLTVQGAAADAKATGEAIAAAVIPDATLAIEGKAADAKAVGERVGDVKGAIDKALFPELFEVLGEEYYSASVFSSGSISTTGSEVSDNTSARSIWFEVARVNAIQIPLGYKAKFCWYAAIASSSFISRDANYQQCGAGILNYIVPPTGAAYFRILLANNSGSEITSSAITELNSNILIYSDTHIVANAEALPDLIRKAYNTPLPARASSVHFSAIKGSMISRTGVVTSDDKYARTQIMTMTAPAFLLDVPSPYAANVSFFTQATLSSSYFISKQTLRYNSNGYLVHKPANAVGVVVEFHRKDWLTITDDHCSAISEGFAIYTSPVKPLGAITQDAARAAFVDYMAQMCEKLGMEASYFANPSGLTSESYTTPGDELKLGVAVAGNPLALDIWSTKDRDFVIGGSNRRTVSIVNNVYSAQPASADYKLLGGKGGSLLATTGDGQKRKAHIGLYDVNSYPVVMALLCAGDWGYDNLVDCAQELAGMMADALAGGEVARGEYITRLLTEGGGYAAVPVPVCAGAYLNAFDPDDILSRENALFGNASSSHMPASTSKTLTMLCALSVLSDLQETVQLVAGDISSGSGTAFSAGDTVTVEEALRIMMMESSNTMALAIGRFVGNKILRADEAKG